MKILFIFVFFISLLSQKSIFTQDNPTLTLPNEIINKKPGKYILKSPFGAFYAPQGVKAMLYIPQTVNHLSYNSVPLIIYYHGVTRDINAFYNSTGYLEAWANEKKFILLSVQNLWALDIQNRDTTRAILDSLQASIEFIEAINKVDLINKNRIFTIGFSAGGFVALCSGIYRPDIIRGFASIKGNFYPDVMDVILDGSKQMRSFLKIGEDKRNISDLFVYLAVGGVHDAPRVKIQQPEAKNFLSQNLKINVIYKTFPNEGHSFSKENFLSLWEAIKSISSE